MTVPAVQKLGVLGKFARAISEPLHEDEKISTATSATVKPAKSGMKNFFQGISRTPARIASLGLLGLSLIFGLRKLIKQEYSTGSLLESLKSFWLEGLFLICSGFAEILNAKGKSIRTTQIDTQKFY